MEPGYVVQGRFEIEARAGAGGMATVYRARDRQTNDIVALKLLGALSERERFLREAEVLAHLDHPNIVRYVAHGELDGGVAFLAMEWLEGESLAARLRREPLGVDQALALCVTVARALGHAHAHGIVHRDVKPSNIMLTGDERSVRVLDFGIARQKVRRDLTQTGMLVGTPGYMAPEQARGSRDVDARADVFALGCLLYKALTQKSPFTGDTVVAVLAKILLEEPTPVQRVRPDVPDAVSRVVMTLLAKDPEARPRDGVAVAELLENARRAEPGDKSESHAVPALGVFEQRMLSIILLDVGAPPAAYLGASGDGDVDATATLPSFAEPVREQAHAFGVIPEPLADGSILVAFRGPGVDQTARAAKCALAIASATPGCLAVLGTGRAMVDAGVPVGDLIDRMAHIRLRATRVHARSAESLVVVDAVTATLLEERFALTHDDDLHALRGERDPGELVRTLLGRPSPCVGRDREIGQLESLLDECIEEEAPRAALLKAPSGFGKSRVRYELVLRVRERAQVWMGRGDPMSAGAPFELITQAIRRAYGIRGDDSQGARRQKLVSRVARHVPEQARQQVVEFIGEIIGAPASDPSAPVRAARKDPVLMGDQVRAAIQTLVTAECAAHPLVIVLEDLHWGDIPTVKLVDALLRERRRCPLFVLATARPDIDDLFPKLWEDHSLFVLPLRELGRKPSQVLVRSMLPQASDAVVDDLVARAGGNAFYLEELIRAIAQGASGSLPETVLATVAARLDRLDPDARRVLRAASVFGQAFWRGGVGALVGSEQEADRWLEVLSQQEIVQRRGESRFEREPELVFRHSFVREAAYATLTESDRVVGHKLAGEWLTSIGETSAVTLAEHFERGGERARAAKHWKRAAEQAMEGNDLARTLELVARGLACEPDALVAAQLHVIRSEAHRWRGELALSRSEAFEGLVLGEGTDAIWYEALGQFAYASVSVGQMDSVLPLAERLLGRRSKPEDHDTYLVALSRVATSLAYGGSPDLADRIYQRIDEALGEGIPAELALARVRLSIAMRALRLKDDTFTLACFGAALEVFERIGDRRGGMYVRVNLGVIQLELGDFEGAEVALREAMEAGIATGVASIAIGGRVNLGLLRGYRGAHDEGLALLRGAGTEYGKLGDHRMLGVARTYAAIVLLERGEPADVVQAEVEARAAAETLAAIATSHADALGVHARALLALGRPDEALARAEEAFATLRELGAIDDGDIRTRLAYAECLLAAGRRDEAVGIVDDALLRVDTRGQNLREPRIREAFLTRVSENVRLRKLALGLRSPPS